MPSISNFSDLDPLENEESISIDWIKESQNLNKFDFLIIPGSKQTIKDQLFLDNSGLSKRIKEYSRTNGNIFGICGGLQILGETLDDPFSKEGLGENLNKSIEGIGLLPLKTTFLKNKMTRQIQTESIWPCSSKINGFEIHNGLTELMKNQKEVKSIFKNLKLGWYKENNNGGTIAGSYIHGIFENDDWRDKYLSQIRKNRNLPKLDKRTNSYKIKREKIINNLAKEFKNHLNISSLLN